MGFVCPEMGSRWWNPEQLDVISLPVPIYLRDGNTSPRSAADGSGQRVRDIEDEKYQYSHNAEDQLTGQDYLGVDKRYYEPKDIGSEKVLRAFLDEARKKKSQRK